MTWATIIIFILGMGCVGVYAMQDDDEYQYPEEWEETQ